MSLEDFFHANPKVALAFSGGVDSSYLLYAGIRAGADIRPYYVKTAFQPEFEFDDARRLADQLGADLRILHLDILSDNEVTANPANRCYFCKTNLFTQLQQAALDDGYSVLVDGTNASDDYDDRPGMKALQELSVRSPLRESGLTKQRIRELSKAAGLFTWDKPAYACLATRIPTHQVITADEISRVERAENVLRTMGFADYRVRVFHGAARIQIPRDQMARIVDDDRIRAGIEPFFPVVMLDLMPRSAS